ncbi:helix-turn-helix domain-containing protein [Pseudomonas extremaustralis]|uniref:helix-turn-helix domain-containing protein n=1 Tax=Pseudomonas extremaustralis TaxID=359110 RepID=UPI002AA80B92|nr:helix-turn-helix domain-containing protein [Pseudomonas extremaustralis]
MTAGYLGFRDRRIELVEKNSIQVVSTAARILRCLESEPKGLSLSVIATGSNLPRSTVQRLVDALAIETILGFYSKTVVGPSWRVRD